MSEQKSETSRRRPLSWEEARSYLRTLLENYLDESTTAVRDIDNGAGDEKISILSRCISLDLDLYAGALLVSIALLVVACMSLTESLDGKDTSAWRPGAELAVYRTQVAASVLLVAGSILSLWMVRRRRYLSRSGHENAKKREIRGFLRDMDRCEEKNQEGDSDPSVPSRCLHELTGSALTGIYPVYRRIASHESSLACWKRIPNLLLVKGDYIALQIGDIAPAPCVSLYTPTVEVATGESVSLSTFGETAEDVLLRLPRGRNTLPADSDHLLTLCNRMRLFRVLESPLYHFIRQPPEPSESPQVARQVRVIRQALWALAPCFLAITAIIVFSRPDAVSGDLTMIIPLPLLATLGVLPIVGPAFVFFLEVLGTARVLTTVHPYASRKSEEEQTACKFGRTRLLLRYSLATCLSRLSLWRLMRRVYKFCLELPFVGTRLSEGPKLVRVPPTSLNLLEKLGVCTAFTLIDDELACEPHVLPQQLLIPSGKGLKLLDLCPAYDEDSDDGSRSESFLARKHGRSYESDSDDSEDGATNFQGLRRKVLPRRRLARRKTKHVEDGGDGNETDSTEDSSYEVQFEDPLWWQYLPSLKCIGLSCLLVDETRDRSEIYAERAAVSSDYGPAGSSWENEMESARSTLVNLVAAERRTNQLKMLAECIGFSTEENSCGVKGDLSPFTERLRLHVLSDDLFKQRLEMDAHERSSELSRWWGLLRPDSTSVIVQDNRSGAYQLLTVGDPLVVLSLCNEAWQGEISTILPLTANDRQTIMETSRNWKLADLDVAAFSYAPVAHTLEQRLAGDGNAEARVYLLDHAELNQSLIRDKNVSEEWTLIRNQIFLGVLGSLVIPRREIQGVLSDLSDAGVRFVYFSPRNMRRQKELASQMGIDVAWNCAISLRPLESGEEDPHRMVSNYADWDVNAKLPHGVEDVRKHLEEVDNVPLLVSLFTDVTKQTTKEMVDIFQEYHDTVIAVGLSHLPWNAGIFSTADIAVGIDILTEAADESSSEDSDLDGLTASHVIPSELEFVSAIASHSCAFRFRGASALSNLPHIIEEGRAALEAAMAAGVFLVTGCISFSLYVLFSVCSPSTTIPFVPTFGAFLFLQILLPCVGLTMAMSIADKDTMKQVPPKNDQSVTFSRREGWKLYQIVLVKAIPPALLPQLLYLIAFGELVIKLEPDLISSSCSGGSHWVEVIRCDALREYSGPARTSAGALALAEFAFCTIVASASFVRRFLSVREQPPWACNKAWVGSVVIMLGLCVLYVSLAVEDGTGPTLPWYYYLLAVTMPFVCLVWNEAFKRVEAKRERRSEKLRRLQFETRLGAWSPK